jgi:hypothetical protein
MAGKDYVRVAELVNFFAETKEAGYEAMLNRDNVLRVMDDLILSLQQLRSSIHEENPKVLKDDVENAQKSYHEWLKKRSSGSWEKQGSAKVPTASESMGRLFGLGRKNKKAD